MGQWALIALTIIFLSPLAQAVPHCWSLQNPLCVFKLLERNRLVNSIRLENIPPKGKFLTVLYAIGGRQTHGRYFGTLHINKISFVVPSILIPQSRKVILPAAELPVVRDRMAFNYLILVFHNQTQFFWTNADHTRPQDPRFNMGAVYVKSHASAIQIYTKKRLAELSRAQGHPFELTVHM